MITEQELVTKSRAEGEPDWLVQKRLQSLQLFHSLPVPSFTYGKGVFVTPPTLVEDCSGTDRSTRSAVVNPAIVAPKGVEVLFLDAAIKKYPALLKKHVMALAHPESNKLLAHHGALTNNLVMIRIPRNTVVAEPVRISINIPVSERRFDNLLVIAEEGSSATIIDTSQSSGSCMRSQVVEIFAANNARIHYISSQELNEQATSFSWKQAAVGKDATVYWLDASLGGAFTHAQTTTYLEGEGGASRNWGLFFGNEQQVFDINTQTIHRASRTSSDMLTRGVLDGGAKAVYRGLVRIDPGAFGCNGYQKEDTLLLSENAEADAIPNLEICNNDVTCSHGATTGQIDPENLFYLQSRGLSEREAKLILIEGFFNDVLEDVDDERVVDEIKAVLARRLEATTL